jgi:predicted Zn-dependent protease with MMP-like domain
VSLVDQIDEALAEGRLADARAGLARAARELDARDPDLRWLRAELALVEWRLEEARDAFAALASDEKWPEAYQQLALCLDALGDPDAARVAHRRARALDPELTAPPEISGADFDACVERALDALPAATRAGLENVRVVREPMPFAELVADDAPEETPPDLLGLFSGPTRLELSEGYGAQLPPVIYLFQRNIERASKDAVELREQIRVTLYHEIGHLLGLDEDEVHELGLG